MGANTFGNFGAGKTAQEAFKKLVEADRADNGDNVYSGTIGTKKKFELIAVPAGKDPVAYAHELLAADDPRVENKYGPAGCVQVSDGRWYFFGWAAS